MYMYVTHIVSKDIRACKDTSDVETFYISHCSVAIELFVALLIVRTTAHVYITAEQSAHELISKEVFRLGGLAPYIHLHSEN